MTIEEYNNVYADRLHKKVENYVISKYGDKEYILCWFDLYHVDTRKKKAFCYEPERAELKREDYIALLFLLVSHPNLTFFELPLYITAELYQQILVFLRIFKMSHVSHPLLPEIPSEPYAVDMATLQHDAKEIIGDTNNACSILLQSYTHNTNFQEVYVSVWMDIMEVSINYVDGNCYVYSKYGLIDAGEIKKILKVKTCKGLSNALLKLSNKLTKDDSDIFWIVRWLDENGIKYTHAEDIASQG